MSFQYELGAGTGGNIVDITSYYTGVMGISANNSSNAVAPIYWGEAQDDVSTLGTTVATNPVRVATVGFYSGIMVDAFGSTTAYRFDQNFENGFSVASSAPMGRHFEETLAGGSAIYAAASGSSAYTAPFNIYSFSEDDTPTFAYTFRKTYTPPVGVSTDYRLCHDVRLPATADGNPRWLVFYGPNTTEAYLYELVYDLAGDDFELNLIYTLNDTTDDELFGGSVVDSGDWEDFRFAVEYNTLSGNLILATPSPDQLGTHWGAINLDSREFQWTYSSTNLRLTMASTTPGTNFPKYNRGLSFYAAYRTNDSDNGTLDTYIVFDASTGAVVATETVDEVFGLSFVVVSPQWVDWTVGNYYTRTTSGSFATVYSYVDMTDNPISPGGGGTYGPGPVNITDPRDPSVFGSALTLKRGPLPASLNGAMEKLNATLDDLVDADSQSSSPITLTIDLNGYRLTNLSNLGVGIQS